MAQAKDWQCNECGRKMTAGAADRAYMGDGCPGCGGCDFEPAPLSRPELPLAVLELLAKRRARREGRS